MTSTSTKLDRLDSWKCKVFLKTRLQENCLSLSGNIVGCLFFFVFFYFLWHGEVIPLLYPADKTVTVSPRWPLGFSLPESEQLRGNAPWRSVYFIREKYLSLFLLLTTGLTSTAQLFCADIPLFHFWHVLSEGTQSDSVWLSTYISQGLLKMSATTAHAHDLLAKSWLVRRCPKCSCCAEIKIMNPSELNSDRLWHSSVYPESSRSLRVLHKALANSAKQLKNCGGRVMSWIMPCSFFGAAIHLRENKEICLWNISLLKIPLEASLFYAFAARGGGEAVEGALQTHKPQT